MRQHLGSSSAPTRMIDRPPQTVQFSNRMFISYRREVSQFMALSLWQTSRLESISCWRLLGGHPWSDTTSVHVSRLGQRVVGSCIDEEDWLRLEIEEALRLDRFIAPVHTPVFDFGDIKLYLSRHN